MNEASVTGDLLEKIRMAAPSAVLFKHADKSTKGMPDVSMSWRRKTVWMEFKYVKKLKEGLFSEKHLGNIFLHDPAQMLTMRRLARSAHASFYLLFFAGTGRNQALYVEGEYAYEIANEKNTKFQIEYHINPALAFQSGLRIFYLPKDYKTILGLISEVFKKGHTDDYVDRAAARIL
jgi:hypothetical protein